ncbi:UDP-glucose/GDP-mannose dehydrogenase family protein [Candidatus Peregrinibacteria bacterium]|nr:UDP-glucose/GDP-mannose dehydrogenase family protein [Candidatus Peregrinibacteria bacterium]
MNISVIGTGYVGLVTGTCLAELGHNVFCVDIDEKKILKLKKGESPIYEPGLEELIKRNIKEKRLSFTTNIQDGIEKSEIIFSAVGTPPGKNHEADLKYVKQVAYDFGRFTNDYKIFVIKSTVPVGTSEEVTIEIKKGLKKNIQGQNIPFEVVSNPEFLREGTAIKDFMNPDRIVVGIKNLKTQTEKVKKTQKIIQKVYEPIVRIGSPLLLTDIRSSEIIKYAANAFLATKISFINEIANFCDIVGGDVKEIAKGIGLDKRIGSKFLHAGIGYGGSCFPKDVKALIQTGKKAKHDFKILSSVENINMLQRQRMCKKIKKALKNIKGKIVAVWGLAFKPKTDDMREAPAKDIIQYIQKEGGKIRVFDPVAEKNAKIIIGEKGITYLKTAYEACENADILLIMTEWDEFRAVDFKKLKERMKGMIIIDGRNIYEREDVKAAGFEYYCFGR